MTQEEKQLLLKDLCARLPYGVIVEITSWGGTVGASYDMKLDAGLLADLLHSEEDFKPYLRPISSMTEEEMEEFNSMWNNDWGIVLANQIENAFDKDGFHNNSKVLEITACFHAVDYINAHHFDYHDLIKKGLALDCTNLNIY